MTQSHIGPHRIGNLTGRLFGGQWPYTRLFGAGPHWYRQAPADHDRQTLGPCAFATGAGLLGAHYGDNIPCGRPYYQHWQAVGEWTLPRHTRWALIRSRIAARFGDPR